MPRLERESVCVLYLTPERPIAASPALAALAVTNPTSELSQPFRHAAASTFAVWPDERPSSAVVPVNLIGARAGGALWDRDMLGRLAVSFLLVTAAPLHALA